MSAGCRRIGSGPSPRWTHSNARDPVRAGCRVSGMDRPRTLGRPTNRQCPAGGPHHRASVADSLLVTRRLAEAHPTIHTATTVMALLSRPSGQPACRPLVRHAQNTVNKKQSARRRSAGHEELWVSHEDGSRSVSNADVSGASRFQTDQTTRLAALRKSRPLPRPAYLTERGRLIHGATKPGGSMPSLRTSDLSPDEVTEVVELISTGRLSRRPAEMPERLRARSWKSVEQVLLRLEENLGWKAAGWKVGAASMEVRRAENIPSPSPGRIFERAIFGSPASIGTEFFVNYRLCECEFAFELGADFPARD